jgi:hypothetical protein
MHKHDRVDMVEGIRGSLLHDYLEHTIFFLVEKDPAADATDEPQP